MSAHRVYPIEILRPLLVVICVVGLLFTLRDDAMRACAYRGLSGPIPFLVKVGADVNIGLVYAASAGETSTADLLLRHGARVDARRGGDTGRTALMEAAARGRLETVKLLIGKGADLEVRLPNGWTALSVAADEGRSRAAALLLKSGAGADAKDRDGKTPMDIAKERGHTGVVEVLSGYKSGKPR
ncbi:MAG: ankyrin repeat domain-containing protein [Pseudomonadota bacterium]